MSLHRGTIAIAGTEVQTGHWIGGERVESADTFSDFSPIDGTHLAEVAAGGRPEVDAAVAAARHASRPGPRSGRDDLGNGTGCRQIFAVAQA